MNRTSESLIHFDLSNTCWSFFQCVCAFSKHLLNVHHVLYAVPGPRDMLLRHTDSPRAYNFFCFFTQELTVIDEDKYANISP